MPQYKVYAATLERVDDLQRTDQLQLQSVTLRNNGYCSQHSHGLPGVV